MLAEQNFGGKYRYGFNGMEMDNEVSGNGNSYTTQFRQYDPRLGRWKSLDPLMAKYPGMSPYVAFNNNPIYFIDPYGLEGTKPTDADKEKGTWTSDGGTTHTYDKELDQWYRDDVVVNASTKVDLNITPSTYSQELNSIESAKRNNAIYNLTYELAQKSFESSGELSNWLTFTIDQKSAYLITEGKVDDSNDDSYTSTVLTVGGVTYSLLEFTTYSEELETWLGKNGKIYSGLEGKGANQYTGSRGGAKSAANSYKWAGRVVFVVSTALSISELVEGIREGDNGKIESASTDLILGAVMTFGGPFGLAIGGAGMLLKYGIDNGYITPGTMKPDWSKHGYCFIAGTEVVMANGNTKNIEDITVGDSVLTVNLNTFIVEVNRVNKIETPFHNNLIQIVFKGRSNTNTFDHPYFVKGKGWCSYDPKLTKERYHFDTEQLEVGDYCVFYENGKLAELEIISINEKIGKVKTYNLSEVSNNHNFFANGLLVHNKSPQ